MAVTRNDVARRAGVSPALVSYVLNNGPRPVSAEARAKIEAAIEELGYRRDAVARYLKTGKTDSIGVVLPDIALPYFAEITAQLNARAAERGYQLLIATSDFDLAREAAQLEALASRRVDGIILMSVDPEQDFGSLTALGTDVVIIDRPESATRGAREATAHLIVDGHRDIGFISGAAKLRVSKRRLAGWRAAHEEVGLAAREDFVIVDAPTRPGGYTAARALFDLPTRPTAVVVESDAAACGVLRAARDVGLDVPSDLAVVSLEGTGLVEYTVPSLTSVAQPVDVIAQDAIARVLALGEPAVRRLDNSGFRLVLRESCGH